MDMIYLALAILAIFAAFGLVMFLLAGAENQ